MSDQYLIAHVGHTHKWDEHICWWKPDSKAWSAIKLGALLIGKYAKPTPITPSKARAIYLDGQP